MLLRDKYLLKNMFGFFASLLLSMSILLLVTQAFWSLADAKHTGVFPWKDWLINFYDSFQLVLPFVTILSALFVFSEMGRFRQILVLEATGISELHIFRTFIFFGFCCSIIAFIAGCFPPYPGVHRGGGKNIYPLIFVTNQTFFWAEKFNDVDSIENVIFKIKQYDHFLTIHSKRAQLFEEGIIFYNASVFKDNTPRKNFNHFILNTEFNPEIIVKYVHSALERESFFRLRSILKETSLLGVKSGFDWIVLYSKLSYSLLNLFIVMLLIPFFFEGRNFSKVKIFIIAFILTLGSYSLYSAGISLGKAEIIPWQISPWLSHLIILIYFLVYLSSSKKNV